MTIQRDAERGFAMTIVPRVLFVCVKNGGKSQIAAGYMRAIAGGAVRVASAGTSPGGSVNALAAAVMLEQGIDISAAIPTQLTEQAMRGAGFVVVLGSEAQVPSVAGVDVETWITDEPSVRGIEGVERMRLVCADIEGRVRELADRLTG
ncbi:Arsenate-mycothiol transferase ArsC1 [Leucobacter aridicollis]|uniref:low molecular weight phosphatase family protein n=1 Tax=Leucobacter aridicollis TaxID=283878 RepID=UPI0037C9D7CC